MPKKPKFDQKKEVRRLARERVGTIPAPKLIVPKSKRKKPNPTLPLDAETLE